MSSKLLPAIPVKHAAVRKVLNIPKPLDAKLQAYIAYYVASHSLDPKQAPSDVDTILALVETFLLRDGGFNRYLRNASAQRATRSAPLEVLPQRHSGG